MQRSVLILKMNLFFYDVFIDHRMYDDILYILYFLKWVFIYQNRKLTSISCRAPKDKCLLCLAKCRVLDVTIIGWRKNMEDAAIHDVDIGDGNSLFAVFDGHGGKLWLS